MGEAKDALESADICGSRPKESVGGHGYTFCGIHWKLSNLPIKFHLNNSGFPAGISGPTFLRAAESAAGAWDLVAQSKGTKSWPSDPECQSANIVCIETQMSAMHVPAVDGKNIIRWANMGPAAARAVASVSYDSGTGRMTDVDITLNSARTWFVDGVDLAAGLAAGGVAFVCGCGDRYDVQSILTHEIGHALGLQHVNPGSPQIWPSDPADAPDYNMVMYERYYPSNATQRVLGWGDIAGLRAAVAKSASDP